MSNFSDTYSFDDIPNTTKNNATQLSIGPKLSLVSGQKNLDLVAFVCKTGAQTRTNPSDTDPKISAPADLITITGSSRTTKPPLAMVDIISNDLKLQKNGCVFTTHDERTGLLMSLEGLYWRRHCYTTLGTDYDISEVLEAEVERDNEILLSMDIGKSNENMKIFSEFFTIISDIDSPYGIYTSPQSIKENETGIPFSCNIGFYYNPQNTYGDTNDLDEMVAHLKDTTPEYIEQEAIHFSLNNGIGFSRSGNTEIESGRVQSSIAGYWCSPIQMAFFDGASNDTYGDWDVVLKSPCNSEVRIDDSINGLGTSVPIVKYKNTDVFTDDGIKYLSAPLDVVLTHGERRGLITYKDKGDYFTGNMGFFYRSAYTKVDKDIANGDIPSLTNPSLQRQDDKRYGGYYFNFWEFWEEELGNIPAGIVLVDIINTILKAQNGDHTSAPDRVSIKTIIGESSSEYSSINGLWYINTTLNYDGSGDTPAVYNQWLYTHTYGGYIEGYSIKMTLNPDESNANSYVYVYDQLHGVGHGSLKDIRPLFSRLDPNNPISNKYDIKHSDWNIANDLLLPSKQELFNGNMNNNRCIGGSINKLYYELSSMPYKYIWESSAQSRGYDLRGVYFKDMFQDRGNHENPEETDASQHFGYGPGTRSGKDYMCCYKYDDNFGFVLDSTPEADQRFLNDKGFDKSTLYSGHENWSPDSGAIINFVKILRHRIGYDTHQDCPHLDILRCYDSNANNGNGGVMKYDSGKEINGIIDMTIPGTNGTMASPPANYDSIQYENCLLSENWYVGDGEGEGEGGVGTNSKFYNLSVAKASIDCYIDATSVLKHKKYLQECSLWCKYLMRYNKTLPSEIVTDLRAEYDSLLRLMSKGYEYTEIPIDDFAESVWLAKYSWSDYLWLKETYDDGEGAMRPSDSDRFLIDMVPDALYRSYKQSILDQYSLNHFNEFSDSVSGGEWVPHRTYNYTHLHHRSTQLGWTKSFTYFAEQGGVTGREHEPPERPKEYFTYPRNQNNTLSNGINITGTYNTYFNTIYEPAIMNYYDNVGYHTLYTRTTSQLKADWVISDHAHHASNTNPSISFFYYASTIHQIGGIDMNVAKAISSNMVFKPQSTFYMDGHIHASQNIHANNKLVVGSKHSMENNQQRMVFKCWGQAMFSDILLTRIPKLHSASATCGVMRISSDIRLKKNIKIISSALNKINKMRGVEWNWRKDETRTTGVIAQEILEIDKDLVSNNDNLLTVNYNALSGYFIEAIKEQQAMIQSQGAEILKLNNKIDSVINQQHLKFVSQNQS